MHQCSVDGSELTNHDQAEIFGSGREKASELAYAPRLKQRRGTRAARRSKYRGRRGKLRRR